MHQTRVLLDDFDRGAVCLVAFGAVVASGSDIQTVLSRVALSRVQVSQANSGFSAGVEILLRVTVRDGVGLPSLLKLQCGTPAAHRRLLDSVYLRCLRCGPEVGPALPWAGYG